MQPILPTAQLKKAGVLTPKTLPARTAYRLVGRQPPHMGFGIQNRSSRRSHDLYPRRGNKSCKPPRTKNGDNLDFRISTHTSSFATWWSPTPYGVGNKKSPARRSREPLILGLRLKIVRRSVATSSALTNVTNPVNHFKHGGNLEFKEFMRTYSLTTWWSQTPSQGLEIRKSFSVRSHGGREKQIALAEILILHL
jgi:hypothetical protein